MEAYQSALHVVRKLREAGHIAYFAGGWVRDFIMQHPSDDIDIATSAPPETVLQLFPNTVEIGLSFGVILVLMENHQYEVATFREDLTYADGRRPSQIQFSSAEEDAKRRDFTINGMFFDPIEEKILDFVDGERDIKSGMVRTIGNAHERFAEDRLRMVRAIRFAARFNFTIDSETREAIRVHAKELLPAVAMERIWQEFTKMSKSPRFDWALLEMYRLGLLQTIFPQLQLIGEEELKRRVSHFQALPNGSSTILYLMDLFPDVSPEDRIELCRYLRASSAEGKLVEYSFQGHLLLDRMHRQQDEQSDHEWAHFYANPLFLEHFETIVSKYSQELRQEVLARHERLLPHIQRIIDKKPLVNATMLQMLGIPNGKKMGLLLKEAERLAVERDLHDPVDVIHLLQSLPIWGTD